MSSPFSATARKSRTRLQRWHSGTRRIGEVLEVRDRWQGLLGPNVWLVVLLTLGAAASPGGWRLVSGAALVLVALCFYPVVRFGPETVRWRNWFRFKEIPTASIQRLGIEGASDFSGV